MIVRARKSMHSVFLVLWALAMLCPQSSHGLPPVRSLVPWDSVQGDDEQNSELDPYRMEWSVFPEVSYSTDDGFFFGAMGVVADYHPEYYPYQWRFEGQSSVSIRPDGKGNTEFPTHDHYLEFDLPNIVNGVRMRFRVAFQRELRRYRGFGNRARPVPLDVSDRVGQYRFSSPLFRWNTRTPVTSKLFFITQFGYQYVWSKVFSGSRLLDDSEGRNGSFVQSVIHGLDPHHLLTAAMGFEYDSRNHETYPSAGMLHTFQVLGGMDVNASFGYGIASAQSRFYVSLYPQYLVLAIRAAVDMAFGQTPVYSLPVLGGEQVLRGVPEGFYHGTVRVLASAEFRSMFWHFNLWKHRFKFGLAAFFDSGRVFADYSAKPIPDGDKVGIRFGTGGGIRLGWGESLVFRFDAAWSPDDIGFYAGVGQSF